MDLIESAVYIRYWRITNHVVGCVIVFKRNKW